MQQRVLLLAVASATVGGVKVVTDPGPVDFDAATDVLAAVFRHSVEEGITPVPVADTFHSRGFGSKPHHNHHSITKHSKGSDDENAAGHADLEPPSPHPSGSQAGWPSNHSQFGGFKLNETAMVGTQLKVAIRMDAYVNMTQCVVSAGLSTLNIWAWPKGCGDWCPPIVLAPQVFGKIEVSANEAGISQLSIVGLCFALNNAVVLCLQFQWTNLAPCDICEWDGQMTFRFQAANNLFGIPLWFPLGAWVGVNTPPVQFERMSLHGDDCAVNSSNITSIPADTVPSAEELDASLDASLSAAHPHSDSQ